MVDSNKVDIISLKILVAFLIARDCNNNDLNLKDLQKTLIEDFKDIVYETPSENPDSYQQLEDLFQKSVDSIFSFSHSFHKIIKGRYDY